MRKIAAAACIILAAGAAACATERPVTLIAEFEDVGDLVRRSNVQQADAVVGTVISIDLEQGEKWVARVTMRLQPGTPVAVGTGALVRMTSLLGENFVELVPPPDTTPQTPNMPDGAVIPTERTDRLPDLEEVFRELGGILASSALTDLGRLSTAIAMIVEGQEENIGRVVDGTAKLLESLARQRHVIGEGIDLLGSTSATIAGGSGTINRFLDTSEDVTRILASQRQHLAAALVELDRFGEPAARILARDRADIERSIAALAEILFWVDSSREPLSAAVSNLPTFAVLFTAAIPGDYLQLDVVGGDPFPLLADIIQSLLPSAPVDAAEVREDHPVGSILWGALR